MIAINASTEAYSTIALPEFALLERIVQRFMNPPLHRVNASALSPSFGMGAKPTSVDGLK